jgi:hypothetical protein
MLTMILGGLWHGAAWTYVLWGAFHGVVLCTYRSLEKPVQDWASSLDPLVRRSLHVLAVVVFFHLVCVSWLLFRAESASQAFELLVALVTQPTRDMGREVSMLGPVGTSLALVVGLLGIQLGQLLKRDNWLVFRAAVPVRGFLYALGALLFIWVGEDGGEAFIYFQF